MNVNLADKVKKFGSEFSHNVKQHVASFILIPAAIAIAGAGAAGCTPKDYATSNDIKGLTEQIVTASKDTQKGIGDQITGDTATTKKYVDGRIEAIEKARLLEETAQDLRLTKEIDVRIEKSRKEINDYFAGKIGDTTGKLSSLEQAVNTAAGANAINKGLIDQYVKQAGDLAAQLKALEGDVKKVSGDTATNKTDYATKIEALKTRLVTVDQAIAGINARLAPFLPPVFPGYPGSVYIPPAPTYSTSPVPPFLARSSIDVAQAWRLHFDGETARAMYNWNPSRFLQVFPYAQSQWFNGISSDEEVAWGIAINIDGVGAGTGPIAKINLETRLTSFYIPTLDAARRLVVDFLLIYPAYTPRITIQTPGF